MDLSTITEPQIVVSKDGKTAYKYRVVKSEILLDRLKAEKAEIEEKLNAEEPTAKELEEYGKDMHPYYLEKKTDEARLAEIDAILEEVK